MTMRTLRVFGAIASSVLLMAMFEFGCTSAGRGGGSEDGGAGGHGSGLAGKSGGAGQSASAGSGGVGGGAAGGGAQAGSNSGGATSGTTVGMGGLADAGMGGSGGGAGLGGGAARPSAGCGKGNARPAGGSITVAQQYYLTFPASYDGTKPLPVLVGFHGCGAVNRGTTKDNTEWISVTRGTGLETEFVRAVPISSDAGGCWNYGVDMPRVIKMYDDLVANHCVDTGRVFATGHSSGAQLITQILNSQHAADAKRLGFKAVAPVAASDNGALSGPMPVMYIQGKMDAERANGDGHEAVARFRTANACATTSTRYTQVAGCRSLGGGVTVDPGCIGYTGCSVSTLWCSHNDPYYNGTMHGIPCFGVKAMYDFFKSLP